MAVENLIGATTSSSLASWPAIAIYVAPAVIAGIRKPDKWKAAIVVCLLLGWTVVGWVLSLVWACGGKEEGQAGPVPRVGSNDASSRSSVGTTRIEEPEEAKVKLSDSGSKNPSFGIITDWFRQERAYDWYIRDVGLMERSDSPDGDFDVRYWVGVEMVLLIKFGDGIFAHLNPNEVLDVKFEAALLYAILCADATFRRTMDATSGIDESYVVMECLQRMAVGVAIIGCDPSNSRLVVGGRHPLLGNSTFLLEVLGMSTSAEIKSLARKILLDWSEQASPADG